MSTWLSRQRKSDLQRYADDAGLKYNDSILKDDLSALLDTHLKDNATSLSKLPSLREYYDRTERASPIKRAPSNAPATAAGVNSEGDTPKPRKRRVTKVKEESEEASPDVKALAARTPRAVQKVAARVPLPPSPAVVTDAIERQTANIKAQGLELWERLGLDDSVEDIRESLSSVVAVQALAFILEGAGIRRETLHMRHAFNTPSIDALRLPSYPVKLPDFFEVLTGGFWAPTTLWATTSLIVPLIFAYFFNLTLKKSSTGLKVSSKSYQADPLAFNIVKALITYLVYGQAFRFWGLVDDTTVATVDRGFYGNYQGVLISSGIGALVSLYEAILKK
ncbi:hypothetical protein EJ05DRAFT_490568 [Pseudovirgaria hyperparasitica]|uniref:Uncharacterized protein n=1 Tax=Pseudovirgaria hyperparasitica TaxID=470096 RepID=A0A6A6VQI8_9PEZI|nr:uncharacterized protein EJ05DRAFT_490568 [Pseudovirgaria hyperparasitica]KAF2752872.1 hypothetical protein EJ05DRAFT_490568 [Pseudovirgaria hyperparasitica]